ncbi:plasmid replication protein [Listeria booriae]|uniref:Plasmid replication protein n=1 Tax=Listeria booriae TaxID=1552123 RepID=A0A841YA28_9LIST|nr:primase C-terminal domain-containing protein [Listeria booriae]MBC1373786.1 plasmid replication protein [Listeria booriae]
MFSTDYIKAIDMITHQGITTHRTRHSKLALRYLHDIAKENAASDHNRKGVHFVTARKEDLSSNRGVKGYITTSKEALILDADHLSHWTPNTFRYGKYTDPERKHISGHVEDNLQQVNTFVVDIDTQQVDVTDIIVAAAQYAVGAPTLVLKTAKGFQVYFVLAAPAFISNANNFKSLRVAKCISQNIKHALASHLPSVDVLCNDFGFFRIPRPDNVVHFNEAQVFDFAELRDWSALYTEKHHTRGMFAAGSSKNFEVIDATESAWFDQLIHLTNIKGGRGSFGRNNAIFTLALACYGSQKTVDFTRDVLDEFNSNLAYPLRDKDVQRAIDSAYTGRYKGANLEYIKQILETYDTEYDMGHSTAFIFRETGNRVFRKHKKARKDRTYSHANEWEKDMIEYLEQHILSGQTFLYGSQRELAEKMNIPLASFKKVLQASNQLVKRTEGVGRSAVTRLSTVAIVVREAIKAAIQSKTEASQAYAMYIAGYSDVAEHIIAILTGKSDARKRDISQLERLTLERRSDVQLALQLLMNVQKHRPDKGLRRKFVV